MDENPDHPRYWVSSTEKLADTSVRVTLAFADGSYAAPIFHPASYTEENIQLTAEALAKDPHLRHFR